MHQNTIQPPPDAFEAHPGLRGPLKRIRALDREARSLYVEIRHGEPDEKKKREIDHLRNEAASMRDALSLPARRAGLLGELRSLIIAEARRMPEILQNKSYRQACTEWNVLKQAALMAFSGIEVPVEYEAALSTLYESQEWKSFRKLRDKVRTKARQDKGWWDRKEKRWRSYWEKPVVKRSKRQHMAEKRSAMTQEQKDIANQRRREAYAAKMARKALYRDMLDEQPVQGSEAA